MSTRNASGFHCVEHNGHRSATTQGACSANRAIDWRLAHLYALFGGLIQVVIVGSPLPPRFLLSYACWTIISSRRLEPIRAARVLALTLTGDATTHPEGSARE